MYAQLRTFESILLDIL